MMTYGQKIFIMILGSLFCGLIVTVVQGFAGLHSDGLSIIGFLMPSIVLLVKINDKLNTLIKLENEKSDDKNSEKGN